jgi:hypothetical protein
MQVDAEDILEISAHFGTLEDPRCHINRKHLLGDVTGRLRHFRQSGITGASLDL